MHVCMQEETGWKLVNGDVFRCPAHRELLCAILGNGSQLLAMCFGVLFLACLGPYTRYNRGALLVAALFIFAFTSGGFRSLHACMLNAYRFTYVYIYVYICL